MTDVIPQDNSSQPEQDEPASIASKDIEKKHDAGDDIASSEPALADEEQPDVADQSPPQDVQSSIVSRNETGNSRAAALTSTRVQSSTALSNGTAAEQEINKKIVEHRIVTEPQPQAKKKGVTSRFLGPIFGLSKPVVGAVLVYSVMATGAWAYLLPNYLALQETVKELETQVDRLEVAVTELESQVDRYEAENEKLEENLEEFATQNEQLKLSNALYAKLTTRLNNTVYELEEQNDILEANNEEYARLNTELNSTAMVLEDEVDALEMAIDDIGETALAAARINDEFLDEAQVLEGLNGTLSEQVDAINSVIIDMNGEIGRLQDLVDELRTILSFLDEAADDIGESYEDIAAFLADQIETNQNILMETLQNTYQQTAAGWVCSFQSFFAGDAFIDNPDSPIGVANYPDVIEYVEDNVLVPLCLDTSDFEAFLAENNGLANPPVDVTANQLVSSVSEYTTAALNYYFPDEGELGLTYDDWAAAEYQCSGLPDGQKFTTIAV